MSEAKETPTTIAPALTPEEWAAPSGVYGWDDGSVFIDQRPGEPQVLDRPHAVAALALHGQPFGFTHNLLIRLRHRPEVTFLDADTVMMSREDLRILLQARTEAADRIAALLPPETAP